MTGKQNKVKMETKKLEKQENKQTNLPRFSFQKHKNGNVHYDFRLECDGVLKSWSIPQGPSMDHELKRLSIRTEDYPLNYIDYEGVTEEKDPSGNPGKILVWDIGTYENITSREDGLVQDLLQGIENGHFCIRLNGQKLMGGFEMSRINEELGLWLLVKMDDGEADEAKDLVNTDPESVKTGKVLEDIR